MMSIAQTYKNVAYLITNKVNGKQYVGITTCGIRRRWAGHCSRLSDGHISAIKNAIHAHGKGNFEVRILLVAPDIEYLLEMEPKLIAAYGTRAPNGYNLTDGGEGTPGCETSDEVRKLRSDRAKVANADPYFRSAQKKGVDEMFADANRKEAWRQKATAGMRSESIRKLRSENQKKLMADPAHAELIRQKNLASWTPERRAAWGEFHRNRWTPEMRKSLSEKGKKETPEMLEKRISPLRGRFVSAEERETKRIAGLKSWARRKMLNNKRPFDAVDMLGVMGMGC